MKKKQESFVGRILRLTEGQSYFYCRLMGGGKNARVFILPCVVTGTVTKTYPDEHTTEDQYNVRLILTPPRWETKTAVIKSNPVPALYTNPYDLLTPYDGVRRPYTIFHLDGRIEHSVQVW